MEFWEKSNGGGGGGFMVGSAGRIERWSPLCSDEKVDGVCDKLGCFGFIKDVVWFIRKCVTVVVLI